MGASFGRGGATNFTQDLQHSDCIVIQGSNMAECHPVGFQWVMEAKARGAKVIHIDPRFTRTSAVADMHVPLRAGSDIAFLGGVVNYILSNEKYFHEYVVAYTNAAAILRDDFRDVDDLDGVFSGYDPETGTYDTESWSYDGVEGMAAPGNRTPPTHDGGESEASQGSRGAGHELGGHGAALAHGEARHDYTLQDPQCVFQVLKRHYARYTPEMVSQACGVSAEQFLQVCEDVTANSGRERTTAWVYSVGWTHHTVGVQYIRGAAIIQLLLGNMGRPGGGILALRGHASIQGSTDIPTLFNLLPGYLPMPKVGEHDSLEDYLQTVCSTDQKGFWADARNYMVSLLKAYWGDAATEENDFAFSYLPRLTGDHGTYQTVMDMIEDRIDGYFLLGQNPAVGSAHGKLQRLGMAHLKWLVVRDLNMIESATFWKDSPEIATGELATADIATEVFFFPAASHVEKSGTFTQTQRMLQWHHKAVEPPGDCRSDLQFFYELGRKLKERLADSTDPRDRPIQDLTWDYSVDEHGEPSAEDVLREINGFHLTGDKAGQPLSSYTEMKPDGIDIGRLLDLHRRLRRRREPVRAAQARARAELGRAGVGLGVAGQSPHAVQPRVRRPRRQAVERAQGVRLVGRGREEVDRPRHPRFPGRHRAVVPSRTRYRRAEGARRRRPVHHAGRRQGLAVRSRGPARRAHARALRAAGVAGRQPVLPPAGQPHAAGLPAQGQPAEPLRPGTRLGGVPLRLHDLPPHRAPHSRWDEPVAALPRRAATGVLLRGVPGAGA